MWMSVNRLLSQNIVYQTIVTKTVVSLNNRPYLIDSIVICTYIRFEPLLLYEYNDKATISISNEITR